MVQLMARLLAVYNMARYSPFDKAQLSYYALMIFELGINQAHRATFGEVSNLRSPPLRERCYDLPSFKKSFLSNSCCNQVFVGEFRLLSTHFVAKKHQDLNSTF